MTYTAKTLAVLLLAASAPEVTVMPGETLVQIAKRELGDGKGGAQELRALNGLQSDKVAPGTVLKLPGPDRGLAQSALKAARSAVNKAVGGPQKDRANERVKEAEQLFRSARYPEASKAADEAWALVSKGPLEPTRFEVDVAESGTTKVVAKSGKPVRVEAQGVVHPVYPGQEVAVESGKPPELVEAAPAAPTGLSPKSGSKLPFKPDDTGLSPELKLYWGPVNEAKEYEIELSGPRNMSVKATKSEFTLPPLPAGRYRWSIRAVGAAGTKSEPSELSSFELVADPLKLEVKGAEWQ